MSLLLHGTTRFPLDGFSLTFVLDFQKSIQKIQVQLAFYQTDVNSLHSAQLVFEWEMFFLQML